nr:response regulator transcription factor [Olsenella uli]
MWIVELCTLIAGPPTAAPLVLIVDDERDIADLLESYFRLEGYRTLEAHDAAGAVAAAHRSPDVILLDVNLPDADGFSVCREIRELVTCPIIFLTARVEDADALTGFAAGGDDYVTKPFSLDVLGARVRAQLARDRRQLDRATMRFASGVAVDLARREVRVGGQNPQVAELARKDFGIVALLASRRRAGLCRSRPRTRRRAFLGRVQGVGRAPGPWALRRADARRTARRQA